MFTGIIEEIGEIKQINSIGKEQVELVISCTNVLDDVSLGDSIATDGTCLTVSAFSHNQFSVQLSRETIQKTLFSDVKIGRKVNLERAMKLSSRLGGHIVQGHVDGLGKLIKIERQEQFYEFHFSVPHELLRYIIPKGSITINGISLTISNLAESSFSVALIPSTYLKTTLQFLDVGSAVNIETDMIAKYVESLFPDSSEKKQIITEDFLKEKGW